MRIDENEFSIPFFKENGFIRKKCRVCGSHYWTQDVDSLNCGDSPCQPYTFIGDPPTKKSYTYPEMRQLFITYFKKKGHTPIDPYPIVARWRDDVYLVGASIFDFQPYVTEGMVPPPANPLVVSQPCLRFTDLDNVGPTAGRHLVIFEMGGAHAFNYPEKKVYWKNETIRFHHQLLVEDLGIKSETINYKEHFWSGGGNAGPDVEACVAGLEISTLVFMSYRTTNGELIEMPIKTVDTGYGIERWTWLSQGAPSGFHAIYGELIHEIEKMAGIKEELKIIEESTKLSSMMNFESQRDKNKIRRKLADHLNISMEELEESLSPIEGVYALADHTKAIAFMLSEGVIPSNIEEGYLARLLIRRSLRFLHLLGLEDRLQDIVSKQIKIWSKNYNRLKDMHSEIMEALSVEEEKYSRTLKRGSVIVNRLISDNKEKGLKTLSAQSLIHLYDSHGLVPEFVKEIAEGIKVSVPENFFSAVAERHAKPKPEAPSELKALQEKVRGLPSTKLMFYKDEKKVKFNAKVVATVNNRYVVLDNTYFYPEGGGQTSDTGFIKFNGQMLEVLSTQKVGASVLHEVKSNPPEIGMVVEGLVNEDRRRSLMRHHTSTHILIGAARRVLGEHAWQAGARKEADRSRLDISHYKPLTGKEIEEIERMACEVIVKDLPVDTSWIPRNEAERLYGFRIYQGGAVPGKEIRIVSIKGWDVEACGGTHCRRTGEVGILKILKVERPQDGVERLIFASGLQALKQIQEREGFAIRTAELLKVPLKRLETTTKDLLDKKKAQRKKLEELMDEFTEIEAEKLLKSGKKIEGLTIVVKLNVKEEEESLIELSSRITELDSSAVAIMGLKADTAMIFVSSGKEAEKKGIHAGQIASNLAKTLGGGGGGKGYFGKGGGPKVEMLPEALTKVEDYIKKQLRTKK